MKSSSSSRGLVGLAWRGAARTVVEDANRGRGRVYESIGITGHHDKGQDTCSSCLILARQSKGREGAQTAGTRRSTAQRGGRVGQWVCRRQRHQGEAVGAEGVMGGGGWSRRVEWREEQQWRLSERPEKRQSRLASSQAALHHSPASAICLDPRRAPSLLNTTLHSRLRRGCGYCWSECCWLSCCARSWSCCSDGGGGR